MCTHTTPNAPATLKQIINRIKILNSQLIKSEISIEDFDTQKQKILGWIVVSHQPVIANLFLI